MALTLYHNDMSVCAQKVRLALAEKGLAYEGKHLNLRAGEQLDPDYMKLNPNGVVPTLVHDGKVLIESVPINEYVDDAFPDKPLRPRDPYLRYKMRWWTKQIDGGVFGATGVVSMSIAFRHQYTPEQVQHRLKVKGPMVARAWDNISKGVDNPGFTDGIKRLDKMCADMDTALADGRPWLLGDYSLADVDYAPYITRLDHLWFHDMLAMRPKLTGWYERMKARPAYQEAVGKWVNPKYLPLMKEKGLEAWPKVEKLLAA